MQTAVASGAGESHGRVLLCLDERTPTKDPLGEGAMRHVCERELLIRDRPTRLVFMFPPRFRLLLYHGKAPLERYTTYGRCYRTTSGLIFSEHMVFSFLLSNFLGIKLFSVLQTGRQACNPSIYVVV